MKTLSKTKISQNLKEIRDDISHYLIPDKIARAMLRLGGVGFEMGGHGVGVQEDWIMFKTYTFRSGEKLIISVAFVLSKGRHTVFVYLDVDSGSNLFTIKTDTAQVLHKVRLVEKHILALVDLAK